MKTEYVTIGNMSYLRRKINGYNILHPVCDGKVDYDHYVYEHRLIYELENNVKLTSNQHIHHKNHIRDDNRPENLVALSGIEHGLLHAREDGDHIGPYYCIDCGAPINSWRADRCTKCRGIHSRVSSHPTKEQLEVYITKMNNCEIARMCGVSSSSVRKWRKEYGLPSASEQLGWKTRARG